jgi:hypothetical protein
MVVHVCNPSYSGGRDWFEVSLSKKLERPYLNIQIMCCGTHLQPQLLRTRRVGGLQFEVSLQEKV